MKKQRKMFCKTIFHNWGGGGSCGTNWPTEVVEIATHYEFDENDGFFTTSYDPYVGQTRRPFYTFHLKRTQRMAFEKLPEVRMKPNKMFKD